MSTDSMPWKKLVTEGIVAICMEINQQNVRGLIERYARHVKITNLFVKFA